MLTSLRKRTLALITCVSLAAPLLAPPTHGQISRRRRSSAGARRNPVASNAKIERAGGLDLLIEQLRAKGAAVSLGEEVSQPFFPVKGRVLLVSGEDVQVFEFRSSAAAAAAACRVNPAGTKVGKSSVSWMAPPHFYRKGRLIAIYVGTSPDVRSVLESVLGSQFAGDQ